MQAPLIVAHTKILFSIMVGAGLGAMAWLDLNAQYEQLALVTACLSMIMVINGLYLIVTRGHSEASYMDGLFIFLLASFSLLTAEQQGGLAIHWIYFYPLAAFFLFTLRVAIVLVSLYLPVALHITLDISEPLLRHQVLFGFVTISLVTLFLAIVKERTNLLLEPLVSADLGTGAQKEKRLHPELTIEINRAEREGTGLSLLLVGSGAPLKNAGKNNHPRLVHDAATAIAHHLRPFDSFYRLHTDDFAVVLPHTTSAEAESLSQSILSELPKPLNANNTPFGFASLNVADTADSLLTTAKSHLNQQSQLSISAQGGAAV